MDEIDKRILLELQNDSDGSVADIAARAGVSQTPCWKRIKRLEESGVIKKRVALLDPAQVGLYLTGYVRIRTALHTETWIKRFTAAIAGIPEVVECHRMAGEIDYMLKVVLPDMDAYDAVYKQLIKVGDMREVSVAFSMERIKETTQLPLDYLDVSRARKRRT